jgi:curli biogenesis system outer membrane secretion channel CsgG
MSLRFRKTPGGRAASLALLPILLLLGACNYGFQGGGGFPSHIRTIYIETFENETTFAGLEQDIFNQMVARLPRDLGVRLAGREVADAIISGRIIRYDDVIQNPRIGADAGGRQEALTSQVQIAVAARLIDVQRDVILWQTTGLSGTGEYLRESQDERAGQQRAIEFLIQQMVDAAQSQW